MFHIYLCLFEGIIFCAVGVVKSGPVEWRQMRGRIYSKFHGRKMSELTPTGLHNTASLFLTLAATTDTLDVVSPW